MIFGHQMYCRLAQSYWGVNLLILFDNEMNCAMTNPALLDTWYMPSIPFVKIKLEVCTQSSLA